MAKTEQKKFKVVRKVEGSKLFELKEGVPAYLKIIGPFLAGTFKKKQATFAQCVQVETGEITKILVSKMLFSLISENYPEDSYVGKAFEIIRGEKVKGGENSYNSYTVNEIEA